MSRWSALFVPLMGLASMALWVEVGSTQELPVVKGKKIVASVNGETITLDEFNREIVSLKKDTSPGGEPNRQAELGVLQRLINALLIVQEARNIGLDKLPENHKMIDVYSRDALREELAAKIMRGVRPDEKEIERIYRDAVRESKISAVLCEKEDDARRFEQELKTGTPFVELAKAFQAQGRARQVEEGSYLKTKDMDPQFGQVVSGMAVGSTSSVVQTSLGFAILRVEDVRYDENPQEEEKARQTVLANARQEALQAYNESLKKKYVKVRRDVLDKIDYEAPTPGFDALLKDTRAVAEIKGDKPVTVAELTEQLKFNFYHGVSRAIERKQLNAKKDETLEGILHRRLFRQEAVRQGLDKTDSYRGKVREYEAGVLFGSFIKKVIQPDIKLTEDEIKAYYATHANDYATPEMMRIRSLAFAKRGDAESAVEKLKAGAEWQWLSTHAEGQVDRNAKGLLSFDRKPLTTSSLPEGTRKVVAGAKPGDFRLYASPDGPHYVLAIQEVMPSKPQPYGQVRQAIAKQVLNDKIKKAVDEYTERLRAVSNVKVYLKS